MISTYDRHGSNEDEQLLILDWKLWSEAQGFIGDDCYDNKGK